MFSQETKDIVGAVEATGESAVTKKRGRPRSDAHQWIDNIFKARQVTNRGIIRRSIHSVKRFASEELLQAEVRKRKFHLVKSGDQLIVFCNDGELAILC